MLELKNIVKDYVSGNNVTHALKGISVNFRKNEFVSILGASGCGKTTTLNIIGGLDRYTSGDLIINGKSTKNYTDRDWDTYRNHSIGFIFQSYNLISHQNILKNVELALTISGVDKEERKARAMKALATVGLAGMEKKKPNQLSGGQCQRVAIARALINNPEILLADEPTGALDSETSVQIMDLLKEVAKDRLVIMVTHNPDLAKKYSTRIITMSDGVLLKDSKPFDGKDKVEVIETNKGKKKKSSMSLWTAAGLSISNLFSKVRRTVLVTIAGSIGIIGVSAVLAVSQGVRDYIGGMQNDMLSSYPISIKEEAADYTSLMTGLNASGARKALEFDPSTQVGVDSMINFLMTAYKGFTNVKSNDINSDFVKYLSGIPSSAVSSTLFDYGLDVTNNIFGNWKQDKNDPGTITSLNGLTQSYIAELQTVKGFSSYASFVNLFTNFIDQMPDNKEYIEDQYDLIAGSTLNLGKEDLVLVVDKDTTLTDLLLAEIGVYDHDDFLRLATKAIEENNIRTSGKEEADIKAELEALENNEDYKYNKFFNFDELINRPYTYYPHNKIYTKEGKITEDEVTYSVVAVINNNSGEFDRVSNLTYVNKDGGEMLVGTEYYIETGNKTVTDYVIALRNPMKIPPQIVNQKDCVNGEWIGFKLTDLMGLGLSTDNLDFQSLTPTQQAQIMGAISFTLNLTQEDGVKSAYTNTSKAETYQFIPSVNEEITEVKGYHYKAEKQDSYTGGTELKISAILRLKEGKNFGCLSRGLYYTKDFADQYMSDALESELYEDMKTHITNEAQTGMATEYKAYVTFRYTDQTDPSNPNTNAQGYASALNGNLSSSFGDLFSSITGVKNEDTNLLHLRSISGIKGIITRDGDNNFKNISFEQLPQSISIYPKDFAAKDVVTDYIDKWNSDESVFIDGVEKFAKDRSAITYTDTIELIITVINTLIEAITIALVAFSSLSLVVSCFMIAVITYISVVERIKEIGVIRSLGGRKGDVASLFVMETLFTGFFSGAFGVVMTYIFQIIFNIALNAKFGIMIANLTPLTAIIMILVSVTLSVVSGLIPSQSAAHKDPVVALRSND